MTERRPLMTMNDLKLIWHYGAIPVREVAATVAVTLAAGVALGICIGKLGIFYDWIVPLAQ